MGTKHRAIDEQNKRKSQNLGIKHRAIDPVDINQVAAKTLTMWNAYTNRNGIF